MSDKPTGLISKQVLRAIVWELQQRSIDEINANKDMSGVGHDYRLYRCGRISAFDDVLKSFNLERAAAAQPGDKADRGER